MVMADGARRDTRLFEETGKGAGENEEA